MKVGALFLGNLLGTVLFLLAFEAHSQKIDSLQQALQAVSEDSLKAKILNNLSYEYLYADTQKAEVFAQQALALAKKKHLKNEEAGAYNHLGLAYLYQSNYFQANRHFEQAYEIFKSIHQARGQAITLNNMGLIFEEKGQYREALKKYLDALAISQKNKRLDDISMCLSNIGNIHFMLQDYDKALEYYQKSLAIDQQNKDEHGRANSLGNIALTLKNLEKYEEAETYYLEALKVASQAKDVQREIHTLANLANLLKEKKEYDKAKGYLSQANTKANAYGDKYLMASVLNVEILLLENQKEYKSALKTAKSLHQLAKEMDSPKFAMVASERLSEIYAELSDFEKAFQFAKINKIYQDSLDSKQQIQAIYNLELERKELEKEVLLKEKSLKNAEIFNQKKSIQTQYTIIISILVLMAILIAWLYFLQKAHRKQKELHQKLAEQNKQILVYASALEGKNAALNEFKEEIQLLNESLEEKIKQRTANLAAANEKLRNYSFLNSHALRRPLANILGLLSIFDYANPENPENRDCLQMLNQSAKELDQVIHDINNQLRVEE